MDWTMLSLVTNNFYPLIMYALHVFLTATTHSTGIAFQFIWVTLIPLKSHTLHIMYSNKIMQDTSNSYYISLD